MCPVKIDLADQIYKWRQNLDSLGKANSMKKFISKAMKFLFKHPSQYNAAVKVAPVVNKLPRSLLYGNLNDWGKGRELPAFAEKSFTRMWKEGKVKKHE